MALRRDPLLRLLPAAVAALALACTGGAEPGARTPLPVERGPALADTALGPLLIPPLPVPAVRRPPDPGETGLVVRLREIVGDTGVGGAAEARPSSAASSEPLPVQRAAGLLARLPPLPPPETATFRFPAASSPPPRTGRVVLSPFHPPDSLEPAPTRPSEAAEPLRVVRVTPSEETELAPYLTITFSEAMVPLASVAGALETTPPARLTPRPPGRWSWLDARTLRFEPEDRFPMATTFAVAVPAGTRSPTGEPLEEAVRATFATPAPRAIGAYPALQPEPAVPQGGQRPVPHRQSDDAARWVSREPVVVIAFDQRVDREAVLRSTRAFAGGGSHELRLATSAEVAADTIASRLLEELREGHWAALRPVAPLPGGVEVRVVLAAGLPSAEGPRTTARAQALRFRTFGPLRITGHGCLDDSTCRPGEPWRIRLSNPLDQGAWSPDLVRVEPALNNMSVRVDGSEVRILGMPRPNTRHTVTLDPSVRDRFGQGLQEPRSVTFAVGAPIPRVSISGAPLIILDPAGPPRVIVHSQGVSALRVRGHRVTPEQWAEYAEAVDRWRGSPDPSFTPPGEEMLSRVVEVAGGGLEFSETSVDVSAALRNALGHAIVTAEPEGAESQPDPSDRRGRRSAGGFAWVQATHIGLAARADREDLFVWATSLRSGDPLRGVEVTLLPSGRRGRTDSDGTVRIELPDSGDAALVAVAGQDAALLPASEHGGTRASRRWQRRSRAVELRWHMLTDRGLYQPGEAVHLKGWLRGMPEAGADPEIAAGVTGVELELRGPRREDLGTATVRPGRLGGFDTVMELPEALNLGYARIQARATGTLVGDETPRGRLGFRVQEFRRPDYEVDVEADPGPHIVGGVIALALNAAYYGGGALAEAPLDWRVTTRSARYRPPGWDRWQFGNVPWWISRGGGGELALLSGTTDATGSHRVQIDLVSLEPPFARTLRAEAQVRDLTRQAGSAAVDRIVHPAALNVGLRPERGWVRPGQAVELGVIVVDHEGRPVPGHAVEVTLQRLRGVWWRADAVDREDSGRVVCRLRSGAEPESCRLTPDSAGPHRIQADVRDAAGRVSRTELMLWVAGAPGVPDPRGEPGSIELVADRDEYQPGDTARILVQPPFHPAEALVTIRNGGVLRTERIRIDGASHELRIPVTEAHVSRAEVRVELVDAEGGLDYATGEVRLSVPPHRRALDVRITPRDTVAMPGVRTTIDVEVRDAAGRPAPDAEVALWMVDEAVLALGGYSVRDPLESFYAPRYTLTFDQQSRRWVVRWPRSAGPGTLSGRLISGRAGRAIAGAIVRVAGTSLEARTAFDGSFTLRGLEAGEYVLEVTSPDGATGRRTVQVPAAGVHLGNLVLGDEGLAVVAEVSLRGGGAEFETLAVAASRMPPPAPGLARRVDSVRIAGVTVVEQDVDVRTDFAPLAFFEPALRTDANGRAQVTARLPQALTRYRVMAVAVAGARRFGTGEATVTARRELMVRLAAPRFLNYGDTLELPVLIQNAGRRTMQVEVAGRASGLSLGEPAGQRLTLGPGARAEIRFDAAATLPGEAHVQVVAVADDGRADAAGADIPVYTPATLEAFATYGTIAGSAPVALPVVRPRDVIEGFGGLDVSITSTALHSLTDAVLYLCRYPFEGAEHIASRVLAVAALRDVLGAFGASGLPDAEELVTATRQDIGRLVAAQSPDGGWAFWPGSARTHPFVSIHVAHALQRAREKGFDVPESTRLRASRYLRDIPSRLAEWPFVARQGAGAYALYVRHRLGDAESVQDARRMAASATDRVGGELPVEAAGWLLAVLAADPGSAALNAELRRTLLNRLVETAGTVTFAERYEQGEHLLLHSRRRTDAVVLEALITAGADDDVVTRLARSLLAHRVRGRWAGTQENAWALLALDRYFRTYVATTPSFTSRVWLGDRFAGSHGFRGRTTDRQHMTIPLAELPRADTQALVLARDGEGRMYYRAGIRYAPADLRIPATDRGFTVARVYEAVDDSADVRRTAEGTWHVRAGARVRVRISLVAPSLRYHAAVVDPLPAGFEPLNPELRGTGFTDDLVPRGARAGVGERSPWRQRWFDHHNLRDDRAEAFAALLPAGAYEFTYLARASTPGRFVVAPPRAEMMYEPETFGRGDGATVVIEDR